MSDDLDNKTDAQLSEIFAVEVSGALEIDGDMMRLNDQNSDGMVFESWIKIPPFSTNVNLVLYYAEKQGSYQIDRVNGVYTVKIGNISVSDRSLAHAICVCVIQFIRAKRAEKGVGK